MNKVETIKCRLTEAEYSKIKSAQKKTGRTMSRFLRDLVLNKIDTLPSAQATEVAKLFIREYSVIGKNVNQIAKSLNIITKNHYPLVFSEAEKISIEQLLQFMNMWRSTLNAYNPQDFVK